MAACSILREGLHERLEEADQNKEECEMESDLCFVRCGLVVYVDQIPYPIQAAIQEDLQFLNLRSTEMVARAMSLLVEQYKMFQRFLAASRTKVGVLHFSGLLLT